MNAERSAVRRQDLFVRLFFRFLLCYLLAFAVGCLLAVRGIGLLLREYVAIGTPLFALLALAGGFSRISGIYLLLLTAAKALWEAQLALRIVLLWKAGAVNVLAANGCLLALCFSLLLSLTAAALARRFAFESYLCDLKLLCSRECARYLLKALLLFALGLCSYLLWSHLLSLFPL